MSFAGEFLRAETAMGIADIIFQPEQIDAMHAAFVIVCAKLHLRAGSRESDRIAARIVDLAKTGKRDATELAWLTLAEIEESA